MQERLKVGIIGLGRSGFGLQCRELDERKDRFEIVAGCDTHKPWLDRMRDNYPDCGIYNSIEKFLANPDIEFVSIATRSVDHFEHAMAALGAGKHVMVEKPICVNYEQSAELCKAAGKSKGNLYVRHNRRFDPDFLHVKEIVDSGILGYIHTIKLSHLGYSRREDWQVLKANGGGQLLDWGSHIIDHALQFLDAPAKPIKNIWSDIKHLVAGGDCEDQLKIILTGNDDCIVDIEISSAVAEGLPEYIIWGTMGSLSLSILDGKINLKYLDASVPFDEIKVDNGVPSLNFDQMKREEYNWIQKTLDVCPSVIPDIWDKLFESIRNNKEFPIKLEQALEVMRIVSEAKKGTDF